MATASLAWNEPGGGVDGVGGGGLRVCGQREQGVSERERGGEEGGGKGTVTWGGEMKIKGGFLFWRGKQSRACSCCSKRVTSPPDCKRQYVSLVFSILCVLSHVCTFITSVFSTVWHFPDGIFPTMAVADYLQAATEHNHSFPLSCCNPELCKASVSKPLRECVCGAIETTATHP